MDLITTTDKLILSKHTGEGSFWKEMLYFYQSHRSFDSETVLVYLQITYGLSTLDLEKVRHAINNPHVDAFELISPIEGNAFDIKPIYTSISDNKPQEQLIYWEDWEYVLSAKEGLLLLQVYIGGIAEQIRAIRLSDVQQSGFKNGGKPFIEELASQLKYDPSMYEEAIKEGRRVI